ncbi:MAG: DNA methyltransferase [Calditrichota bacterium]
MHNPSEGHLFPAWGAKVKTYSRVHLNKDAFMGVIESLRALDDIAELRARITQIAGIVERIETDTFNILNIVSDGDALTFRKDVLLSDLRQIKESQTLSRAQYYINRLGSGISNIKTNKINDINLSRWKEADEIITDSLWVLKTRDNSGAHLGWYWGNYIPQIPHQMMLRYTKKGDWVLDPFAGSGTTLIECRRLGRNGLGIELNAEVSTKAAELISSEPNIHKITSEIITGDSRRIDLKSYLSNYGINKVQLLLMHPPYHDIIRFSDNPNDLSNAKTKDYFIKMFGQVVANCTPLLEAGRFLAVVIGDKYEAGEWVPLGFYCMNEVLKYGYSLKGIIVKNFEETRGKRNQHELWRYRALVGGFYIFKHEYILLFKKDRKI